MGVFTSLLRKRHSLISLSNCPLTVLERDCTRVSLKKKGPKKKKRKKKKKKKKKRKKRKKKPADGLIRKRESAFLPRNADRY